MAGRRLLVAGGWSMDGAGEMGNDRINQFRSIFNGLRKNDLAQSVLDATQCGNNILSDRK